MRRFFVAELGARTRFKLQAASLGKPTEMFAARCDVGSKRLLYGLSDALLAACSLQPGIEMENLIITKYAK